MPSEPVAGLYQTSSKTTTVGENKRDSALTTTTTLSVVSHAAPQRTIFPGRNDSDTQSTKRERDPGSVFFHPKQRRRRREFVGPFTRFGRHARTVCQLGKTTQATADGNLGPSCPRKVGLLKLSTVITRGGFLTGNEQDTLSVRGGVPMVRIIRSPRRPSLKPEPDSRTGPFDQDI